MTSVRRRVGGAPIVVPAIGVIVLGLAVMLGWIVRGDALAILFPDDSVPIVFATAAGLVITGLGLFATYQPSWRARRANLFAGWALVALGAMVLFEHATGVAVGIDLPGLHGGLGSTSGRMSLPTAGAFLITGALLLLVERPVSRFGALGVQALVGLLLAVATVSLIARDVPAEGLLPWYRYSRMATPTAFAFIAVGVAMLALIARSRWYETIYSQREDEKILIVAMGILLLVAVTTSAAGFVMMQKNLESAVRNALAQAVADRAAIIENLIANRVARATIVASRPDVRRFLGSGVDPGRVRFELLDEGNTYLGMGFRGVGFDDAGGERVATAGFVLDKMAMEVPLRGQISPASLAWEEAFVLRTRTPVVRDGDAIGTVIADQRLELLARLQIDVGELGETAEWALCGAHEQGMACFPQRFVPYPRTDMRARGGAPVPMDYALRGQTGVVSANDYRGIPVIAGYTPIGNTGLGVVLKIDAEEVYSPLRDQLGLWWRWFWGLAIVGALLLASQMRPIARRLVQSEMIARDRAEALARSERSLRELYTSLGDGIVVLKPDGVIEFMNPAAERLFGIASGESLGLPVAELVPEALRDANLAATRRFLRDGTSNVLGKRDLVFPALRRDGSTFDAEFSLAEMGHGDERRLVAVVRDVSERTALARMKRDFVAAVSHELRTPLTSIIGSLEMMRESDPLPEPQASFLDMAWRNSARLSALVDDVIDSERIESGALKFENVDVEIAPFLRESAELNASYARARETTIEVEEPLPQARVHADRSRLAQVMANLLSNAAKFSRPGGRICIRARAVDRRVRIEVEDQGSGIPDEFRPRVFEKFAQAINSDSGGRTGTGLGLPISKSIVERLGGTIDFESRIGEGSTFWFELPLAA